MLNGLKSDLRTQSRQVWDSLSQISKLYKYLREKDREEDDPRRDSDAALHHAGGLGPHHGPWPSGISWENKTFNFYEWSRNCVATANVTAIDFYIALSLKVKVSGGLLSSCYLTALPLDIVSLSDTMGEVQIFLNHWTVCVNNAEMLT